MPNPRGSLGHTSVRRLMPTTVPTVEIAERRKRRCGHRTARQVTVAKAKLPTASASASRLVLRSLTTRLCRRVTLLAASLPGHSVATHSPAAHRLLQAGADLTMVARTAFEPRLCVITPVRSARPRERRDGVTDSFARVSAPARGAGVADRSRAGTGPQRPHARPEGRAAAGGTHPKN
jgi:hypothetical protein